MGHAKSKAQAPNNSTRASKHGPTWSYHVKIRRGEQSELCKVVKRAPSTFDGQHHIVARRHIKGRTVGVDIGLCINDIQGEEIA